MFLSTFTGLLYFWWPYEHKLYLLRITLAIFLVINEWRSFRHANMLTCFISLSMKILPYVTTPYFQEVGWV